MLRGSESRVLGSFKFVHNPTQPCPGNWLSSCQSLYPYELESRFQLTKEAREFLDAKNEELEPKLEGSEADLDDSSSSWRRLD